jgi:lipoprotein-anchoring transpeptidase ErfK/SrfK
MRDPTRHHFALAFIPRPFLACVRLVVIALIALFTPACIQFHMSDGSGGFYDRGRDVFSTPARLFHREAKIPPPATVARVRGSAIVVDKPARRLLVYDRGKLRRQYDVALGVHPDGRKAREGDRRTPEGVYRVLAKKDRGETRYHRALLIDYPNASDRALFVKAKAQGKIPKSARIGGLIEIHGGGTGVDWTDGCVALENKDMDDLFRRVRVGTPILILGPRATEAATF